MLAEIKGSLKLLQLGLSEAVWQTRCVICDVPGAALCDKCSRQLPYLDQLSACPLCGAPWGRGICCECNQQTLRWKGLARFPLDGCVSAVLLSPETKRIVTVFKDRGERQLSEIIAHHMANVLPPSWQAEAVLVPIPARTNAVRERGFDHISLIGAELSRITGMPLTPLSERNPAATSAISTQDKGLPTWLDRSTSNQTGLPPMETPLRRVWASCPASY